MTIIAEDQDGNLILMCVNHHDEPAVGEDLYGYALCDGCARGLDARDEAAQDWDEGES